MDRDLTLLQWPPVSPILTPINFFFGFVKYSGVPPLYRDMEQLQECNTISAAQTVWELLQNVWAEMGYVVDVCRVTHGALIEEL